MEDQPKVCTVCNGTEFEELIEEGDWYPPHGQMPGGIGYLCKGCGKIY